MPSRNTLESPASLTPRETEVLAHIAGGDSSESVAKSLCVSKRTVDFHLSKCYFKLGVHNRIKAVNRARELGLIGSLR